ncbi:MAG: hypothetical protein DRP01_02410 [Archaeoglobales archaeon]|nr:MAG: hypothetical protein DRP01_02410 [Archaeoglobales archaeon]
MPRNPTRKLGERAVEFLRVLSISPMTTSQLADKFDLSLSQTYYALKLLEALHLVKREVAGKAHRWSLTGIELKEAKKYARSKVERMLLNFIIRSLEWS